MEQQIKKCPNCQTEVSEKEEKCPKCKTNLKSFMDRHSSGLVLIIPAIIIILVAIRLSGNSSSNNQSNPNTSSLTPINTNSTSTNQGQTNKDENLSFQKITIKDLVTSDFNDETTNHSGFTIPFVEYQGTVTKEYSEQGNYYFKIEDGNGYSAIASIDPKKIPDLNKKLNVGDVVIIRGINSSLGDCKSQDESTANFCKGVTESNLPITLLMAPDPQLGNKQPVEIISSSSVNISTPISQPIQNTQPVTINYSSYPRMQIDQYAKNPPAYSGTGVELTGGIVSDFLASGDRGGSTNYIEVENGMDPSLDKLEIQVSSNSDYQNIISQLNKGDFINVFGLGSKSKSFTSTNGNTTLIPSIIVQKIEKCEPYNCKEINTTVIFSK